MNRLIIVLAAILALAGGVYVQRHSQPASTQQAVTLDFSAPDLDGTPRTVQDWQGKIRIVNFWATWCPPCLKEIPEFIHLQQKYQNNNVQFIGIAIDDKDAVTAFIEKHPVNYPLLIANDVALKLTAPLGNVANALPFSLILNPQGQIVYRHLGELSADKLEEQLAPLL